MTAYYESVILADGPEGYWPLSTTSLLDDISGNNFDLTSGTSGGAQSGTGPFGDDCYDFNGTSHYLKTNDGAITTMLGTDSTLSFESWFISESAATLRCIAGVRYTSEMSLHLHNTASNGNARGYRYGNFRTAGAGALNDSAWHHRVDVVNGTSYEVFIDGTSLQVGTTPVGGTALVPYVVIGANYGGGTGLQFFDGRIAHVAVYDYNLTSTQITDHYDALANPPATVVTGTMAGSFGSLTGAMAGAPTRLGVLAGTFGGLQAAMAGVVIPPVLGTMSASFGGLTGTALSADRATYWRAELQDSPWSATLQPSPHTAVEEQGPWDADLQP